MKTLIVAPQQPDLAMQQAEVQRLVNTLDGAQVLLGAVTWPAVADEIQRFQPDILWFATHGNSDGIILSDVLVDGDMLASVTRGGSVRLIVLNTCDSRAVAERIHAATGCDVVATIGPVDDRHAFTVAQRFAALLLAGYDPHRAFSHVRTPQFVIIPEMIPYNNSDYDALRRMLNDVQMENERLKRMIDAMEDKLEGLRLEFQQYRIEQNQRQAEQARQFRFYQNAIAVFGVILAVILVLQLAQVFQ